MIVSKDMEDLDPASNEHDFTEVYKTSPPTIVEHILFSQARGTKIDQIMDNKLSINTCQRI